MVRNNVLKLIFGFCCVAIVAQNHAMSEKKKMLYFASGALTAGVMKKCFTEIFRNVRIIKSGYEHQGLLFSESKQKEAPQGSDATTKALFAVMNDKKNKMTKFEFFAESLSGLCFWSFITGASLYTLYNLDVFTSLFTSEKVE